LCGYGLVYKKFLATIGGKVEPFSREKLVKHFLLMYSFRNG